MKDIINLQSSLEDKNGLGFKAPQQNVKDEAISSYENVLKGKYGEANVSANSKGSQTMVLQLNQHKIIEDTLIISK